MVINVSAKRVKKNYEGKVVAKNAPGDFIASPVSTSFPHVLESHLFQQQQQRVLFA